MADMDEGMWKGASWKQEEDFTVEADGLLDRCNATILPVLLRSSNQTVEEICEELLALEKKARLAGDAITTSRVAVEVLKMFRTAKQITNMLDKLEFLMRRRGQTKQVQSAMIAECALTLVGEDTAEDGDGGTLTEEERNDTLQRLIHLTEGKIHVELEHARFTVRMAVIAERDRHNRKEAADMLQEIQVETIANMPRVEKLGIIMKQLELALAMGDVLRIPLISRKVTYRALGKRDTVDLKVRYFGYMADYFQQQGQALMVAKCHHELYLTSMGIDAVQLGQGAAEAANKKAVEKDEKGEDDDEGAKPKDAPLSEEASASALVALSNCAMMVMISEHLSDKVADDQAECCAFSPGSAQRDRLQWLMDLGTNHMLQQGAAPVHGLVVAFNSQDLIREETGPAFGALMATHPMVEGNGDRQLAFQRRLSEHDMLVVAKSFKKVRIGRLAELVALTAAECEEFIMTMVNVKALYAKIDRIDGVVVFEKARSPAEDVEEWNRSVETMMTLVEKTGHFMVKERMLHSIANKETAKAA